MSYETWDQTQEGIIKRTFSESYGLALALDIFGRFPACVHEAFEIGLTKYQLVGQKPQNYETQGI